MNIRGIILGAGSSRRMGRNKLDLKFGEKSMVEMVIENAKASKLDEIVLVTGKYDIATDIKKLHNDSYHMGMSTSIIKGMENYYGDGVMILLGDMPYVSTEVINYLYEAFQCSEKNILVPAHKGKRGNPVILGVKYYKDLLCNTGDKGARDIINSNLEDVEFIEVNSTGIFIDVDDEEKYNSLKS
jgi:molybdenum cofactor cytidylyltransferase